MLATTYGGVEHPRLRCGRVHRAARDDVHRGQTHRSSVQKSCAGEFAGGGDARAAVPNAGDAGDHEQAGTRVDGGVAAELDRCPWRHPTPCSHRDSSHRDSESAAAFGDRVTPPPCLTHRDSSHRDSESAAALGDRVTPPPSLQHRDLESEAASRAVGFPASARRPRRAPVGPSVACHRS